MFNVKVTGLDQLQRKLNESLRGLQSLDGEIAAIQFNPGDPESVARAVREMETAVDAKAGSYANDPLISKAVMAMKQEFRERIQNAVVTSA
jgi:hypothetical protein